MRKVLGLDVLVRNHSGQLTLTALSTLILEDLKSCCCMIFGKTKDEEPVLLAELKIMPETLYHEIFDHRIEFTVAGEILSHKFVPLTYNVQGKLFSFHGRCSVIPQVCGVDLYLSSSFTGEAGDIARQKISISVKPLLKTLKLS